MAKKTAEASPEDSPVAPGPSGGEADDFKYIVRVASTDLDGQRSVVNGLTGLKGVGSRTAEIIADKLGLPWAMRLGELTDEQVEELAEIVEGFSATAPPWLLNRRNDLDTGEDRHLVGAEVDAILREDINRMKMIRCYRGIRHERGHKVRGQRTRSNGRSGLTVGVMKKAARLAAKKQG